MPASIVGTYSVPATSSSNAASVAATRALYGLMVRNNSLIRTFPSRPPPRPDICTSSQYQSYLNNLASRVATNVSICADLPIGRVRRGRGAWRREAWGAGEMVGICLAVVGWQIPTTFKRYSAEKRSRNARLWQSSKSRPSWEAQREEAHQKENQQKEVQRKETQQKKGAAGGDPCRCDELFA